MRSMAVNKAIVCGLSGRRRLGSAIAQPRLPVSVMSKSTTFE
jgi:hypothetical protein